MTTNDDVFSRRGTPGAPTDSRTAGAEPGKSLEERMAFKARLDAILIDVRGEVEVACRKFAPFTSAHEGYAVILEELDELWQEVKKKPRDRQPRALETEAVQVAAMAVRFLADVVGPSIAFSTALNSPEPAPAVREDVAAPVVPLREKTSSS